MRKFYRKRGLTKYKICFSKLIFFKTFFQTQLIENKFQNIHGTLFIGEQDQLSDVDEIRLSVIFEILKQTTNNEEIKEGVRAIFNRLKTWPFDNL